MPCATSWIRAHARLVDDSWCTKGLSEIPRERLFVCPHPFENFVDPKRRRGDSSEMPLQAVHYLMLSSGLQFPRLIYIIKPLLPSEPVLNLLNCL